MLRVTAVTMLITCALACLPMEGERYEDGCDYADEVYDDLYEEGMADANEGVAIFDGSWRAIDCTGEHGEEWISGCNECALEAWNAGWTAASPE